jgi:hypothetical protein
MKRENSYILQTGDEDRKITIYEINRPCPDGNLIAKGVFGLSEGVKTIGEIVFDDNMDQWEYTGMGNLTHDEALEIATFIKENKVI